MKPHEHAKHKSKSTFYAYRLKNGTFYKRHNKGSWDVSLNGVSKKDITTGAIAQAARFYRHLGYPTYDANFMNGGKWVKVVCKEEYTWEGV